MLFVVIIQSNPTNLIHPICQHSTLDPKELWGEMLSKDGGVDVSDVGLLDELLKPHTPSSLQLWVGLNLTGGS